MTTPSISTTELYTHLNTLIESDTPVTDQDEVSIIPAMAGGR